MDDPDAPKRTSSASVGSEAIPGSAGGSDGGGASRRKTVLVRVLLGFVVAFLVAVWAYAFYEGNQPLPDRLDDQEITAQAEQICSVAVADNKELPQAFEMESAAERAAVIEQSDEVYATMIDRLDGLEPATTDDVGIWDQWIVDWRTYLGDRADYVDRLRADPMARFYVTEKDRDQVTEPIDRLARVNGMLSCATPLDLG